MSQDDTEQQCHCACGKTTFTVRGAPIIRGFCHCTICQAFNSAPFSDITVVKASNVDLPEPNLVEYTAYRQPPILQRGRCTACGKPAIEFLRIPLLPSFAVVPTGNFSDPGFAPEPALHIFYDSRVADIDDGLPKYSGYLKSQAAFTQKMVLNMLRGAGRT